MHAEGRPVDILAVTGNMDEEHRTGFAHVMLVLSTDDAGKRVGVRAFDITGLMARFSVCIRY